MFLAYPPHSSAHIFFDDAWIPESQGCSGLGHPFYFFMKYSIMAISIGVSSCRVGLPGVPLVVCRGGVRKVTRPRASSREEPESPREFFLQMSKMKIVPH